MQNHNIGVGEDDFNGTAFDGTKGMTCLVKTFQPRVALRSLERVSNAQLSRSQVWPDSTRKDFCRDAVSVNDR